jgi:hypothetical protein
MIPGAEKAAIPILALISRGSSIVSTQHCRGEEADAEPAAVLLDPEGLAAAHAHTQGGPGGHEQM